MKYVMYNFDCKHKPLKKIFDASQTTTAKLFQLNYCRINDLVPGACGQLGSRRMKEYQELILSQSQQSLFDQL